MNQLIKITIFLWLMTCALFAWVGSAMIGFFFMFSSDYSFIGDYTPFIAFTCAICIIKCAMYVLLKSNPTAYIEGKFSKLERLLGKKKVQR